MAPALPRVVSSAPLLFIVAPILILGFIFNFCALSALSATNPLATLTHHFTCDLHLVPNVPPQCRRSTGCRSPAWLNVYGGLQSALSWRTTVFRCRRRRSWRRCQRRHWRNTTSAVCWTRPQMLTWAPGKSRKNTCSLWSDFRLSRLTSWIAGADPDGKNSQSNSQRP